MMRYGQRTLWSSGGLDLTLLPYASFPGAARHREAACSCRGLGSLIALRNDPDSTRLIGTTWASSGGRDDRACRRLSAATGNRRSSAASLRGSPVPGGAYERSEDVIRTPPRLLSGAPVLSVEPSTRCEVRWTSPGVSPVWASCSLGVKCILRATTGISQPFVFTLPLSRWFSNARSNAARLGNSTGQKSPTLSRTRGLEQQRDGAFQLSPDTAFESLPKSEGDSKAMRTGHVPRTVASAAKWKPSAVHLKNQQQVVVWKNNKTCVVCKKEVQAGQVERLESACEKAWRFIVGYSRSCHSCPVLPQMRVLRYGELLPRDRSKFDGKLRRPGA
ncbi:hypothetical protein CSUI_009994 [Cystoisospora suis]|uniref:Uncharacterized protein n=1 Tax=Cystoisospora suis TaxID=483139 RepID=A0A2C6KI53_9APIC|nr:hypothetical protein CSUI_009994 [Cystoisospora suis]